MHKTNLSPSPTNHATAWTLLFSNSRGAKQTLDILHLIPQARKEPEADVDAMNVMAQLRNAIKGTTTISALKQLSEKLAAKDVFSLFAIKHSHTENNHATLLPFILHQVSSKQK